MPYFPTTTNTPKAILASAGSVTWLLGGLVQGADPNAVQDVYGEAIVAAATLPASPTMNAGRSVNTYSLQSYFLGGGAATLAFQASMTNRAADFVTITPVNGTYQTNLPFVRVLLSAITAGTAAVAIIY